MGEPENQITRAVRQVLDNLGIYNWKVLQGLGSHRGVSDIIAVWPKHLDEHEAGKIVCIEVKTKRGRVSEPQKKFLQRVADDNGLAIVVRGVDDLIDGLGVRKRFLF